MEEFNVRLHARSCSHPSSYSPITFVLFHPAQSVAPASASASASAPVPTTFMKSCHRNSMLSRRTPQRLLHQSPTPSTIPYQLISNTRHHWRHGSFLHDTTYNNFTHIGFQTRHQLFSSGTASTEPSSSSLTANHAHHMVPYAKVIIMDSPDTTSKLSSPQTSSFSASLGSPCSPSPSPDSPSTPTPPHIHVQLQVNRKPRKKSKRLKKLKRLGAATISQDSVQLDVPQLRPDATDITKNKKNNLQQHHNQDQVSQSHSSPAQELHTPLSESSSLSPVIFTPTSISSTTPISTTGSSSSSSSSSIVPIQSKSSSIVPINNSQSLQLSPQRLSPTGSLLPLERSASPSQKLDNSYAYASLLDFVPHTKQRHSDHLWKQLNLFLIDHAFNAADISRIKNAFYFAAKFVAAAPQHKNFFSTITLTSSPHFKKRVKFVPPIVHVFAVAKIIIAMKADTDTVIAGILAESIKESSALLPSMGDHTQGTSSIQEDLEDNHKDSYDLAPNSQELALLPSTNSDNNNLDIQDLPSQLKQNIDTGSDIDFIPYQQLARFFGSQIKNIVKDEIWLGTLHLHPSVADIDDDSAKLLQQHVAMASADPRAVIVKLADALHSIRNASYLPSHHQHILALESLQVFVPLAHAMGLGKIMWELEDLSLRILFPSSYTRIEKWHEKIWIQGSIALATAKQQLLHHILSDSLLQHNIRNVSITARTKNLFSTFKKIIRDNKTEDEVLDILAMRVIIDPIDPHNQNLNHSLCLRIHHIVKQIWPEIPRRFKDYIKTPKPNGYQSLHTTVILTFPDKAEAGNDNSSPSPAVSPSPPKSAPVSQSPSPDSDDSVFPLEVQIRTLEMHDKAEFGAAGHHLYKGGINNMDDFKKFTHMIRLDNISLLQPSSAATHD